MNPDTQIVSRPSGPLTVPATLHLASVSEAARQFGMRFSVQRARLLAGLRSAPAVSQLIQELKSSATYVIEWSPAARAALRNATATWQTNADGTIPVVLRAKEGGAILEHLKLREIAANSSQCLSALNNLTMQLAIAEILTCLEELDEKLVRVIAGQRADRGGLVLGGEHLYRQALQARGEANRAQALHSALQCIAQGRAQLMQAICEEAAHLRPASGSAIPFKRSQTARLKDTFIQLESDAKLVALATKSMILINEELHEPDMARVALLQCAEGLLKPAPILRAFAQHVPYSKEFDPARMWSVLVERVSPAVQQSIRTLDPDEEPQMIACEFSANELLSGGDNHG